MKLEIVCVAVAVGVAVKRMAEDGEAEGEDDLGAQMLTNSDAWDCSQKCQHFLMLTQTRIRMMLE